MPSYGARGTGDGAGQGYMRVPLYREADVVPTFFT